MSFEKIDASKTWIVARAANDKPLGPRLQRLAKYAAQIGVLLTRWPGSRQIAAQNDDLAPGRVVGRSSARNAPARRICTLTDLGGVEQSDERNRENESETACCRLPSVEPR